MDKKKPEKWEKEIEQIIRQKFPDDLEVVDEVVNFFKDIIAFVETVEKPDGYRGMVISLILKKASEELRPFAATLSAFQLGAAWQRYLYEQRGTRKS